MSDNPLAIEITFPNIMKFAAPTIAMLLFRAFYSITDGIFVARFVGSEPLSAISIFYPVLSVMFAISAMLALGGSVVVSRQMGEGDEAAARDNFSMTICVGALIGIAVFALGTLFVDEIANFLGAKGEIHAFCREYMLSMMPFMPMLVLLMLFQSFFVAAGKPLLGMWSNVAGGIANIVLDYLFIAVFGMGLTGAGLATGTGYSLPALFGFFYFSTRRENILCLVRPTFRQKFKIFTKICVNGSSEFISNISEALTTFLFNITVVKHFGGNGAAALIIILYVQFSFSALFYGYSDGVVSLISYNYGSGQPEKIRKLLAYSLKFTAAASAALFAAAVMHEDLIVQIFAERDTPIFAIASAGLSLFSFAFLLNGTNMFAACFFNALSNGRTAAVLSFLRTLLLPSLLILILPGLGGPRAVWLAMPIAESVVLALSAWELLTNREKYGY